MKKSLPVLFLAHGSPMNAIADNSYSRALRALGQQLPRPRAILCISAHWMSKGSWVTAMARPKTIHDFGGFPQELFAIQYPAPGSPELAAEVRSLIPTIQEDASEWGLDHGTWSVLRHLYPAADIPVVQLSLDMGEGPRSHFDLGKKLRPLRERGVLIMGSGNIVHNLRKISWSENAPVPAWASEFDEWAKERLDARDFHALVDDALQSEAGRLSVPTPDHYYPLLYALGAAEASDSVRHVTEGMQNASISMRSVQFG